MGAAPYSLYGCLSFGSGFACLVAGICVELAQVIVLPVVHLYRPMLVIPFINSFFTFPACSISFSTDLNSIGKGRQYERGRVVFDITTASKKKGTYLFFAVAHLGWEHFCY
jgi:hypothetical protein